MEIVVGEKVRRDYGFFGAAWTRRCARVARWGQNWPGYLRGPQARSSLKESLETTQNCGPALGDAQKNMASWLESVVDDCPGAQTQPQPTQAQIETVARLMASQNYAEYSGRFISPSISLMVKSGLWIELYAVVGFLVGLGLSSLMGQRTVPVILLILLEIVLTPLLSHSPINHLINIQRALVGIAVTHTEPGGLPSVFGGGNRGNGPVGVSESTTVAICVVVGWVVVWSALGAWRMVKRDA